LHILFDLLLQDFAGFEDLQARRQQQFDSDAIRLRGLLGLLLDCLLQDQKWHSEPLRQIIAQRV